MVKVKGSKGKNVNVEIKGIAEAFRKLRSFEKDVENDVELEIFRNANFLQQEIQESIIGNRAEPKSVDTGRFGNSIEVDKIDKYTFKIYPERKLYPGTTVTTSDIASFMEFGTSQGISPRRHFRNSVNRNRQKIQESIKEVVKQNRKR